MNRVMHVRRASMAQEELRLVVRHVRLSPHHLQEVQSSHTVLAKVDQESWQLLQARHNCCKMSVVLADQQVVSCDETSLTFKDAGIPNN